MPTFELHRLLALLLVMLVLPACNTMQTTYFRGSYQALGKADNPVLLPFSGQPGFSQVEDMSVKSREMLQAGYMMLGYSQFVSPLLTSLAESYSTKWGAEVGAAHVVLETPLPGESNLHYYLVTYWGRYDPAAFTVGVIWQDLPEELLQRIGDDRNLVVVLQVIPGTPAADAGLRANDLIAAIDGDYVENTKTLTQRVTDRRGKEVRLGLFRTGESLEIPVRLAEPQPRSGTSLPAYRETPWVDTQARDWSSLSLANLAASNMAATAQRIEQDRQLHFERARAQAQRNLDALNAKPAEDIRAVNRRGGSVPQQTPYEAWLAGKNSFRIQQDFNKQMKEFGRSWGAELERERQQQVMLLFEIAPGPGTW